MKWVLVRWPGGYPMEVSRHETFTDAVNKGVTFELNNLTLCSIEDQTSWDRRDVTAPPRPPKSALWKRLGLPLHDHWQQQLLSFLPSSPSLGVKSGN